MKIAIITHYFDPHVGGIEVVAEAHASRLAARGHDVTVVTTAIDAPPGREKRDGYDVVRYAALNPLEPHGMPYPIPDPIDCHRTVRSTVDEEFELVHVHGFNYLTSLLPLLSIWREELPVILHQHTPFVDYSPVLNVVERLNDNIVGRAVLRQVDHCIAVSTNIAEYAVELGADSVQTMYNGVDTERFSPEVAPSRNEFLYLGRLTQKKGVQRLLETVGRLDRMDTDAVVRIAGKGEMAAEVESLAASNETLRFEGFVSSTRLPELYSRARGLIVPRQGGDAFPTLTTLEALASGTPPILVKDAVDTPGFTHHKTYLQAQPTPKSLTGMIQYLAEDDALAEAMAIQCRRAALYHYEWEDRIDELERTYTRFGNVAPSLDE